MKVRGFADTDGCAVKCRTQPAPEKSTAKIQIGTPRNLILVSLQSSPRRIAERPVSSRGSLIAASRDLSPTSLLRTILSIDMIVATHLAAWLNLGGIAAKQQQRRRNAMQIRFILKSRRTTAFQPRRLMVMLAAAGCKRLLGCASGFGLPTSAR